MKKFGIDLVELWKIIDVVNNRYWKKMFVERKIKVFFDVLVFEELKKLNFKFVVVSNVFFGNIFFVLRVFDFNKYFDFVFGKDYLNFDGVKFNLYLI